MHDASCEALYRALISNSAESCLGVARKLPESGVRIPSDWLQSGGHPKVVSKWLQDTRHDKKKGAGASRPPSFAATPRQLSAELEMRGWQISQKNRLSRRIRNECCVELGQRFVFNFFFDK